MKASLLALYDLMDAVIYIVLLEEEILTRRADKDVMSLSLLPGITKSPDAAFQGGPSHFSVIYTSPKTRQSNITEESVVDLLKTDLKLF